MCPSQDESPHRASAYLTVCFTPHLTSKHLLVQLQESPYALVIFSRYVRVHGPFAARTFSGKGWKLKASSKLHAPPCCTNCNRNPARSSHSDHLPSLVRRTAYFQLPETIPEPPSTGTNTSTFPSSISAHKSCRFETVRLILVRISVPYTVRLYIFGNSKTLTRHSRLL